MGDFAEDSRVLAATKRGIALILVSVMLPVIIGFSLLAIDMSRVNNLHNDLQKGADAFALAAAAELDGESGRVGREPNAPWRRLSTTAPGSRQRAVADPGSGQRRRCDEAATLRQYLLVLPREHSRVDGLPIRATTPTTDRRDRRRMTRFIEVTVTPGRLRCDLPGVVPVRQLGQQQLQCRRGCGCRASHQASATSRRSSCATRTRDTASIGGVTLRAGRARSGQLSPAANRTSQGRQRSLPRPGQFRLPEPPAGVGNGARRLRRRLLRRSRLAAIRRTASTPRPGRTPALCRTPSTSRFGINANGNLFNSAEYGPASMSGRAQRLETNGNGNKVDYATTPTSVDVPRAGQHEVCPATPTTPYMGGRMGDGNWNFSRLLEHQYRELPAIHRPGTTPTPTRYEVYKYEIATIWSDDGARRRAQSGETGTPAPCQPRRSRPSTAGCYTARSSTATRCKHAGNNLQRPQRASLPVEAVRQASS